MNYFYRAKTTANYSDITTAGGSGVSWARTGAVVTVTHNGHGKINGDIIEVTVSSATTPLPLGTYTVTRIDDNDFSVVGVDSGDASGTCTYTNYVWYDAATAGNKYDTKPDSDDDVTIVSTNQCTLSANETANSVTINASTTLSLATFNLDLTGAMTINGTLIIGTSADTGLTLVGLTAASGSHMDMQTGSKINNSSDYSCHASAIFSTNNRGTYTQTGDGNYTSTSYYNYFYSFIIEEGVTLTCAAYSSRIADPSTFYILIDGTLNCSNKTVYFGCSPTGSVNIGANGNITGSNSLLFFALNGATFINNRTSAFSFSGVVNCVPYGLNNQILPAWDFSNASISISFNFPSALKRYISSGTLKCKDFTISNNNTGNAVLDCSANPSFEISGNIDLNADAGVYTTLWTKGTGTITLKGSSGTQTLDLDNQVLEDIILDCAGAEKQIVVGGTTDSLSGTGGTLNSSVAGTQRTLICAGTGVCSNVTFKDISVGSANKVNAKNSCTNQGNCLGIVFKDVVK